MFKIIQVLCKSSQQQRIFYHISIKTNLKRFIGHKVRLNNIPAIKIPPAKPWNIALAISILSWLGFDQEDEDKESELIMTLKRAVLCTQREEYEKAEQMLHIALRIAQQQQNEKGVLYCYDLMANLAFDTYNLEKAEKLFVSVLQMLLSSGTAQDDMKVIHISLKLARINQLKADTERADLGYKWCLEQIEHHKSDENGLILYGIINDWYAQYLLDVGQMSKALTHLREAYKVCNETQGNSDKTMLLLNDLGITSFRAEDYDSAETFLKEAIELGNTLEDKTHLGVVHANLGLILLQKGILNEAEKFCLMGRNFGKQYENVESVQQSNYCLDQIKMNMKA